MEGHYEDITSRLLTMRDPPYDITAKPLIIEAHNPYTKTSQQQDTVSKSQYQFPRARTFDTRSSKVVFNTTSIKETELAMQRSIR
jgi:hypothetical protein